jgi:hypothetical protein
LTVWRSTQSPQVSRCRLCESIQKPPVIRRKPFDVNDLGRSQQEWKAALASDGLSLLRFGQATSSSLQTTYG